MHFVLVIILVLYMGIYKTVMLPVLTDSVHEMRSYFPNEGEGVRNSKNNIKTLEKGTSTF